MQKNKEGFSIIVAVFMVGFLLVLTTWVLNLVMRELIDNKWSENSLKAYAWAEWAMELGLLWIKENGYGFDESLETGDSASESLTFTWTFNPLTDPKILYDMDVKISEYYASWSLSLWTWSTVLIPLFWLDSTNTWSATQVTLSNLNYPDDTLWNIIGDWQWMSWSWSFVQWDTQVYRKNDGVYSSAESIQTFLWANTSSYLMLFNKSATHELEYKLSVLPWEFFSKPVWNITSTVTVWKYKQNISTSIDNTEFLNMLKYSLYSNQ